MSETGGKKGFVFWLATMAILAGSAETLAVGQAKDSHTQITVSAAQSDSSGFLVHQVSSPHQAGKTILRVLLPDVLKAGEKYRVIYVLPVEAMSQSRYGDGLAEVKKQDLHNKHGVIFVAPSFSQVPWYADHPDKPEIRQESFLLKAVIPFIDKTYPTQADAEHRLLVGFSKSGWGAWSLLLRNPEVFGKAAAWDAPVMMDTAGKYGSGDIFGTQENFAKYRIETLLREHGKKLGPDERLILTGYGGFREDHARCHALLSELKIPHHYQDGPQRKHDWHSGWVSEAVDLLLADAKTNRP